MGEESKQKEEQGGGRARSAHQAKTDVSALLSVSVEYTLAVMSITMKTCFFSDGAHEGVHCRLPLVEPMTCVLEIEANEDAICDDAVRWRHWKESLADSPRAKRAVARIDVAN